MRLRISASLLILGLAILASAAGLGTPQDPWKPDTQVGDFQFNMPDGWKRVESKDGPMLVPTNLPKGGTAFIGFLPAQDLPGDFRSWFDATWADGLKQFKLQQAGEITAQHHANGFDILRIDARVSNQALGYSEFVFAGVRSGKRVAGYFFLSNTGYYSYRTALSDFENTLHFGNGPSARGGEPSPKTGAAGGLQGLYIGYKMRGLIGLKTHFEYLVFFPDGNLVRYLPEHGLDNFDFRAALRESRDYCGRYRISGNQIAITWADNNTEIAARDGTALKIGGDSYFPVPRSDGLKLNGTYHQEGTDVTPYFIRFTADGRFNENGILNLLAYSDNQQAPGNGTYRIGNNTITLNYADGRKVPLSFYIFGENAAGPVPNRIHINTYPLVLMP